MRARVDGSWNSEASVSEHRIELECYEVIGSGGARRVSWHIEQAGDWTSVADLGQVLPDDDRPPGTVWRRRYAISLSQGTRLMRVESGPASDVRRDPMDYLLSPRKSPRRTLRSYFKVGERGQLLRQER
jgi:hypothetical protein